MGFWAQNGPKVRFRSPKSLFGFHFGPWLKRLMKQRVSWLLFRTFGAKIQKWAHFSTFGRQNAKKGSFCTFGAKSAKMSSFSVFGSQSAQKGSSNHLFHKPFGPGRKMTPKVLFWAQKCTYCIKMGFWSPKTRFGLQNAPWRKGVKVYTHFLRPL